MSADAATTGTTGQRLDGFWYRRRRCAIPPTNRPAPAGDKRDRDRPQGSGFRSSHHRSRPIRHGEDHPRRVVRRPGRQGRLRGSPWHRGKPPRLRGRGGRLRTHRAWPSLVLRRRRRPATPRHRSPPHSPRPPFDPCLAIHTSRVEPLPHQITAVYGAILPRQPLRFRLADDPGAGKTIMAGLLIKELMIRGDVERCLVVAPVYSWSSGGTSFTASSAWPSTC